MNKERRLQNRVVHSVVRLTFCAAMISPASMIAPIAFAQEDAAPVRAITTGRPMLKVFYSQEQRRVLEAIRQGIVPSSDQFNESAVLILEETIVPSDVGGFLEVEDVVEEIDRPDVSLIGYIRSKKSIGGTYWSRFEGVSTNELRIAPDEENEDFASESVSDGTLVLGNVPDSEELVGLDRKTNSRFSLKVGQGITNAGALYETLPVIRRSKAK